MKNIGFVRSKIDQKYTEHKVTLKANTKLYLSTDVIKRVKIKLDQTDDATAVGLTF